MSLVTSISNGLGSQSMWMLVLFGQRKLNANVCITADTGWEKDRLWNTGERTTAGEYFRRVVEPLCKNIGLECKVVRPMDKFKQPLPTLIDHTKWCVETGKLNNLKIPLFGSKGGRLMQACTDKWKIRAINQALRALGAKKAMTWQGIHYGEADRRMHGWFLREENGYSIYQTTQMHGRGEKRTEKPIKWLNHGYPLVDLRLNREQIRERMTVEGIPFLESSECDGCPHKDLARWERTSEPVLTELSELEASFKGLWFFTSLRIPLLQAISQMRSEKARGFETQSEFGCKEATCGV